MTVWPNPVESWNWPVRGAVLTAAAVAFLLANEQMKPAARKMRERGGVGIVGFEFIRSWARAAPLLERWGVEGRRAAKTTLWCDTLLFIPAFTALLGTLAGCVAAHAQHRGWPGWSDVGALALYATATMALLDLVENFALARVLAEDHRLNFPRVATTASTVKWALFGAVVLTIVTVALLFLAAPRG